MFTIVVVIIIGLILIVVMCVQQSWGAMAEGESDEFKRVLLEGNPFFLALTFCVSLLHSVFDFFAFKNDIGFWRNKKSVEGLSVRSIGINCFMQVIQPWHVLPTCCGLQLLWHRHCCSPTQLCCVCCILPPFCMPVLLIIDCVLCFAELLIFPMCRWRCHECLDSCFILLQLIIFLYLLDNETSTVVLLSAGAGTAIEFWKVTKAMKVSVDWSRGFPLPKFEDKAGMHYRFVPFFMLATNAVSCANLQWQSMHVRNRSPAKRSIYENVCMCIGLRKNCGAYDQASQAKTHGICAWCM